MALNKNDHQQLAGEHQPMPIRRWFFRVKGGFIIISSLSVGLLAWLVLSIIAENLRKNPDVIKGLPGLVNQCIAHRALVPLAALPALACGVMLLPKDRSRPTGWLLILAATAWLFGLFGLILYCFVSFLAPLYQYQPL